MLSPYMICAPCEGKRLLVRKKHTGVALRDGCKVYAARELSTQAQKRAVEVGFHGRLRHFEHSPDLREAQLSETAQAYDRRYVGGSEKTACCNKLFSSILSVTSSGSGSGSVITSIGDSSSSPYFNSRVDKGISVCRYLLRSSYRQRLRAT